MRWFQASKVRCQRGVQPENKEDAVKELVRWVVNTILLQEKLELVSEMVKYRKYLSQPMFSKFQHFIDKPADMTRFFQSGLAGVAKEWPREREAPGGAFLCDIHKVHEQ